METSRRGTGSAIGEPEQSSPPDHPFRPTGAPELLCSVAVVVTEQARVLPLLSVGEMTLRLYAALNYSPNSAHDLRRALNEA